MSINHVCDECKKDPDVCLCENHLEERLNQEYTRGYNEGKAEKLAEELSN